MRVCVYACLRVCVCTSVFNDTSWTNSELVTVSIPCYYTPPSHLASYLLAVQKLVLTMIVWRLESCWSRTRSVVRVFLAVGRYQQGFSAPVLWLAWRLFARKHLGYTSDGFPKMQRSIQTMHGFDAQTGGVDESGFVGSDGIP